MQILMTKTAHDRVRERLAAALPNAEVVVYAGPGQLELNGKPTTAQAIQPEIAWITQDAQLLGFLPQIVDEIAGLPSVRWMQGLSAGLERPSFKTIMRNGARVSKGSAQATPIAEYVVGHAISLILPMATQAAQQRERVWKRTPYHEIGLTHWLLVGYGAIGHEVAKRIKPFGTTLTIVRRDPSAENTGGDRVVTQADLPQVLPQADVVVLACALTDETRGLANSDFFAAMKPGAILINVGRGGLVDEDALRAGLDRDQPGFAVLDVFAKEPLPDDAWFWDHPKVRVSAHTSPSGDGMVMRGDELFFDNLQRYLAGEKTRNEADKREVGL